MKTKSKARHLSDEVTLLGRFETITVGDFRRMPGEILACVLLGKTYLIQRHGKPVAVLSQPPGVSLTTVVDPKGKVSYELPTDPARDPPLGHKYE
jgi:hypothetical protein